MTQASLVQLRASADELLVDAASTARPLMEVGMIVALIERLREETGQTMAEYAVVLAVITIAVVVTLGLLSTAISSQLNSVIGIL
jgi:Flp pilus assembly pilin Flp